VNLFDLARSDAASIFSNTATSVPVILTEPDGTRHEIRAHVYRIEEQVDPETGARIYNPATFVAYSEATAPVATDTWSVSLSVAGEEVSGLVVNVRQDFTIGMVTLQVEIDE
jgi:hypothetical protein